MLLMWCSLMMKTLEQLTQEDCHLTTAIFSETKWSEGESEEQFQRGEFRQEVCPVSVLPCEASALDFFHLLFTLNMVDIIVRETNKYALQCLASSGKNPSSFDKVTEIEMLVYLGLIIAMSLHPLHCIRDYWSTEWVLARIFTVARFEIITGTCI